MKIKPKPLRCSQCDCRLNPGDPYFIVYGDVTCRDCVDDWIRDELVDRFGDLRDKLVDLLGIPSLEVPDAD